MRTAMLALPILFGMGAFTSAAAQDAGSVQLPAAKSKREIQTRVGVITEHHTNIAQTDAATAASRGIERNDWTVRPVVQVRVLQPLGRNALFVNADGGYLFHKNNTRLDSRTINVSGGGVSNLGSCQVAGTGTYSVSQSELGDIVGPIVKNLRTTRSVGAQVNCGRPVGFGGSLSANRSWARNSATTIKEANSTTDTLQAAVRYQNKGLGTIAVQGSYVESRYPNRQTLQLSALGLGETVIIRNVGVEYQKTIGSKLNVAGSVALTRLKRGAPPNGVKPKFSSTTYSGDMIYKFTSRTQLEVSAERSVKPSNTVGKLYDKETRSEIELRHNLGTRLLITLGASRDDLASNTDGSSSFLIYTKARTDSIYGSIRYQRAKLGSLALELRQDDRNTDKSAYDYRDTRAMMTLEAQF
ncbi:MAG: outer membrane beta-barrel protein [Phenylobacterium sp.]|uniref:hypothetical protein n=1 Tax=Phenylobacterium sp. TaxID=1871053 RepID=UPI0025D87D70|nr:hypothetical protein [Phenylobacterium sp.]MBI1198444.1 outer membrane beta-barrel protein [Phenylobacterium sp.]